MPALAMSLSEFSDKDNSRTWTISGHTVAKPKLLIQKRKIGSVGGASSVDTWTIVQGTVDAAGAVLPGKVVFDVSFRRPIEGASADVTSALSLLRDLVASDEFGAAVTTQNYVKP